MPVELSYSEYLSKSARYQQCYISRQYQCITSSFLLRSSIGTQQFHRIKKPLKVSAALELIYTTTILLSFSFIFNAKLDVWQKKFSNTKRIAILLSTFSNKLTLENLWYGLATISRTLKNRFLFAEYRSRLQGTFELESYDIQEPTNRNHPVVKPFDRKVSTEKSIDILRCKLGNELTFENLWQSSSSFRKFSRKTSIAMLRSTFRSELTFENLWQSSSSSTASGRLLSSTIVFPASPGALGLPPPLPPLFLS